MCIAIKKSAQVALLTLVSFDTLGPPCAHPDFNVLTFYDLKRNPKTEITNVGQNENNENIEEKNSTLAGGL